MPTRKVRKQVRKKTRNREVKRKRVVPTEAVMNKHHRLPRSRGGSSSADNISILSIEVHRAWHYLFGNANAQEVAGLLEPFIDHNFYMVAMPRKRVQRSKRRTHSICTTCGAEVMKLLPKTNATEDSSCGCTSCFYGKDE